MMISLPFLILTSIFYSYVSLISFSFGDDVNMSLLQL